MPLVSTSGYVGYVSDPNGRGTVSLVCSCLLTLLLCVWSALHLNLPAQNASNMAKAWSSIKWITIGVYAPELVVFAAWRQWSSARLLGEVIADLSINDASRRRHKWTKTHNFFASTGGLAFELDADLAEEAVTEKPFLPSDSPRRLTITARGVALLAQCGHLPDMPEGEIWDKSKANNLAKALVILQALWMLLQVLSRLIAKLPVTLLEVNTVAHVLCALLMYAMWWYKPLTAEEPIILRGPWVESLCAYMFMCSEQSGKIDKHQVQAQTVVKRMFVSLAVYSKTPEIQRVCLRTSSAGSIQVEPVKCNQENGRTETEIWISGPSEYRVDDTIRLSSKASLDLMRQHHKTLKGNSTAFFERRPRLGAREPTHSIEDPRTLRRWELAAKAIATYPQLRSASRLQYQHKVRQQTNFVVNHNDSQDSDGSSPTNLNHCLHPLPVEYVTACVSNWPYDDLLRDVGGLTVGIVLWMCNFVYGGIHATAWNEHFPSTAEQWLWRASCVYISFCGGLWIILNLVASKFPKLNSFWENWMDGQKSWVWSVVLGGTVILCGSSFCFSRAYLVLQAFVSIRSLDPRAYDTPDWSQLFPHF